MATDRRTAQRIPLNAWLRVRAAGSSGRGILCSVRDSSSAGIRFHCREAIDPGWIWIEVLKSTGQPPSERIEARVVRCEADGEGGHDIGCAFD